MSRTSLGSKIHVHADDDSLFRVKPPHHTYSLGLISLALDLLAVGGLGLRSCVKVLHIISRYLPHTQRLPCFNTLRNWRLKHAYARLDQPVNSDDGPWALLIDESICIGKRRILVVLGLRLKSFDFTRPLTFEDIVVLSVKMRPVWRASHILSVLQAQQQRGIDVAYIVSDRGPNLVKAIQELGCQRVDDCGHALALILKREYAKRKDFESFNRDCTAFKRRGNLSDYAHLMPPALRFHSRFMNLHPVVRWAKKMITLMDHQVTCELIQPYRKHLEWLLSYRELINELAPILEVWQFVLKLLKTNGLDSTTERAVRKLVAPLCISVQMKNELENYLATHRKLIRQYGTLVCSTDIVESYFGRFKAAHSWLPTAYCITLVDYGQKVKTVQVHWAMSQVKLCQMYKYLKAEFGQTLRSKRRALDRLIEN